MKQDADSTARCSEVYYCSARYLDLMDAAVKEAPVPVLDASDVAHSICAQSENHLQHGAERGRTEQDKSQPQEERQPNGTIQSIKSWGQVKIDLGGLQVCPRHCAMHVQTVCRGCTMFPQRGTTRPLTWRMTSLRPGQRPPQVTMAAFTSCGRKYTRGRGPARTSLEGGGGGGKERRSGAREGEGEGAGEGEGVVGEHRARTP